MMVKTGSGKLPPHTLQLAPLPPISYGHKVLAGGSKPLKTELDGAQ